MWKEMLVLDQPELQHDMRSLTEILRILGRALNPPLSQLPPRANSRLPGIFAQGNSTNLVSHALLSI
jgi:hypothetical protein